MKRRQLLKAAASIPLLSHMEWLRLADARAEQGRSNQAFSRVRPGDAAWPSEESWNKLGRAVEGRLIKVNSPLNVCREAPDSPACAEVFKSLRNPYYIGDQVGLTQTSGWVGAWTSRPSVYAVAARKTDDIVAAVNFARENKLRLVVKGGGHSYQGTSCAPDSLLIWTREMNAISLHQAFVGKGCEKVQAPQPAVSVGAGAIWLAAYEAVTTRGGRYVQGGGCTTVGVAGLIPNGGVWRALEENRPCNGGVTLGGGCHRRRCCAHRQCLYEPRPLLGPEGRWRGKPGRCHPGDAPDARTASVFRRRIWDDHGAVRNRLPRTDRPHGDLLCRSIIEPSLGRTDEVWDWE